MAAGFRDCLREPILIIGFFQQARSQTGGRHAGSQFAQASGLFSIDLQELRVTDASMSKGHAEPISKKAAPFSGQRGEVWGSPNPGRGLARWELGGNQKVARIER